MSEHEGWEMAKKSVLSQADVMALLDDPSASKRVETARKIAIEFSQAALTATQRRLAEDIFRLMVKDAEIRVREALADNLKSSPLVPRDVAMTMAHDVGSVALPVLQYSDVLTDEDLLAIIHLQDTDKQVAIASRASVSEIVSEAIVETEKEEVVTRLVANPGADISDGSLGRVVEALGDREAVQQAMVSRPRLPVTVVERLVTLVSEHLKAEIAQRFDLPADTMTDLILQIRERAILSLSSESSDGDLHQLVRQLKANGRLTPSIVLRALCMGDLAFFEAAMAELAGISILNARELIHDAGKRGLKALFDRASLPRSYFPAIRAAIDVTAETAYDGGELDRERHSRRMIERILTQYGDLGVQIDADDLEYLLTKMDTLPIDPAPDA
jgi:uncharacterized protein (DUF2336 family)